MKRVFDVYLLPEVMVAMKEKGQIVVPKVYSDIPVPGMKKSRFGYEGDLWAIPEHGRYVDEHENIVVFPDDTGRKRSGNTGMDIIPPVFFREATIDIRASKLPRWAVRTWGEIIGVQYPKRVQELSDADIMGMGFYTQNPDPSVICSYTLGDYKIKTTGGYKEAFRVWWNLNMGGHRTIKKLGNPHMIVAYPYREDDRLPVIETMGLPMNIHPNPYVILYTVKAL